MCMYVSAICISVLRQARHYVVKGSLVQIIFISSTALYICFDLTKIIIIQYYMYLWFFYVEIQGFDVCFGGLCRFLVLLVVFLLVFTKALWFFCGFLCVWWSRVGGSKQNNDTI